MSTVFAQYLVATLIFVNIAHISVSAFGTFAEFKLFCTFCLSNKLSPSAIDLCRMLRGFSSVFLSCSSLFTNKHSGYCRRAERQTKTRKEAVKCKITTKWRCQKKNHPKI